MNVGNVNIRGSFGVSGGQNFAEIHETGAVSRKNTFDLDKNMQISFAKSNPLDALNKTEDVEEPTRNDNLSNLMREVFNFEMPAMPNFV